MLFGKGVICSSLASKDAGLKDIVLLSLSFSFSCCCLFTVVVIIFFSFSFIFFFFFFFIFPFFDLNIFREMKYILIYEKIVLFFFVSETTKFIFSKLKKIRKEKKRKTTKRNTKEKEKKEEWRNKR